jgi:hypothetical protein
MKRMLSAIAVAAAMFGCRGGGGEGMEASSIPPEVRDDYDIFAQRCSKCHSLARPLESGIEDDVFWEYYVARMRRMPGSGISPDDAQRILRFLRYYSAEQRKRRGGVEPHAANGGQL